MKCPTLAILRSNSLILYELLSAKDQLFLNDDSDKLLELPGTYDIWQEVSSE
jgi:hypothetical protein